MVCSHQGMFWKLQKGRDFSMKQGPCPCDRSRFLASSVSFIWNGVATSIPRLFSSGPFTFSPEARVYSVRLTVRLWAAASHSSSLIPSRTTQEGTLVLMRCAAVGVSCELLTQMAVGKPLVDRLFLLTHEYLFLGCTEGMAEGEKFL